jgi:hypothetical protein
MKSLRHFRAQRMPLLALLGLALSLASLPCRASLGTAPSDFGNKSVRHARVLAATSAATGATGSAAAYDVNTSVLDNGTTVREYVANGVVFAVSWTGPFLPDLRALLGQQFTTLTSETARRPKAGNSQVRIVRPDVTIESTGHMRAYAGRAWVNSLLPAGFDTSEIE